MTKIKRTFVKTSCGLCKIIEYNGYDKSHHRIVTVRFIKTGFIRKLPLSDVVRDNIKDYLLPSVHNVGYLGEDFLEIRKSKYHKVAISRWRDMIRRCYDKTHETYHNYKNTIVDDKWHNYSNFFNDIFMLPGFNSAKFTNSELSLDKDKLQINMKNKIYGKDTCCWINMTEQFVYRDLSKLKKSFRAISPDGIVYHGTCVSDFAKEHNLNNKGISKCFTGERAKYKGWKFKPIEKCND